MCSVDGCGNAAACRGLCWKHYKRLQRTGLAVEPLVRKMCPACCRWFKPSRADQIFDSARCRVKWSRMRRVDPRLPARPDTVAHVSRPAPPPQPKIRVVPFTRSQVLNKCRGLCALCGRAIDVDAVEGTPLAAAFVWSVAPEVTGEASLANRVVVHEKCRAVFVKAHSGRKRRRRVRR